MEGATLRARSRGLEFPLQVKSFSRLSAQAPILIAALLGALALLSLALGLESRNSLSWITHTSQVRTSLTAITTGFIDMLVSERQFLVSGDDEQIAINETLKKTVLDELATLGSLISDNADQVQRLSELKSLFEQRVATGDVTIGNRRASGAALEWRDPLILSGQAQFDAARAKIREMQAAEQTLYDQRTSSALFYLRGFTLTTGVGALAVAGSLLMWWRQSKRVAAVLAESNARLVQSYIEAGQNEARIRQMQKMEIIGQLSGGLAHDFNNMLSVVIASLTLAKKRLAKGAADIGQLIDSALDGAQRAATLTSRLLAFSRQQPLAPQALNLNRIVGGISELIARTLGEAIRVETVLAGGLWIARVDASQMENALLNLCVNARDAMPDGGSLTIETGNAHLDEYYALQNPGAVAGQYVLIAVTDTGTGMIPEVAAQVFEPYFTTKPVGRGSGLGLSQVFGFVKQSGGHVKIYTEPGQGTTVKLYFARSFEADAAVRQASQAANEAPPEIARGDAGRVILVVEDESRVRALTTMTLRELGYTALHAADGEDALRVLDEHPEIAVLFTDIVMPGINGRKLADEALIRRPDLKVLFTTGFTRNAVVHGGVLDAGVNLLSKPFTIEQLAAKMSAVIAQEGS